MLIKFGASYKRRLPSPCQTPSVFRCAHLRPADLNPGHRSRITRLRSPNKNTQSASNSISTHLTKHTIISPPLTREPDFQLRCLWTCILMVPRSLFVLREKASCHHMSSERGIAVPNHSPAVLSNFLNSDEVLRFDGLRHCMSALNICKNITLSKSWLTFHRPPVDSRFSHHCTPSPRSAVSSTHARQASANSPSRTPRHTVKPKFRHRM